MNICITAAPTPEVVAQLYPIFQRAGPDQPQVQNKGFLLSRYDEQEFAAFLAGRSTLCAAVHGVCAGFVVVEAVALSNLTQIDWLAPVQLPEDLQRLPLRWIRMMAVAPRFRRQGIGSALYRYLFMQWPQDGLLTGLYEQPLDNRASRAFHRQLGFRRVGESSRHHAGEAAPRVSGIYYFTPQHASIDR